jgi:hypothetical protein
VGEQELICVGSSKRRAVLAAVTRAAQQCATVNSTAQQSCTHISNKQASQFGTLMYSWTLTGKDNGSHNLSNK